MSTVRDYPREIAAAMAAGDVAALGVLAIELAQRVSAADATAAQLVALERAEADRKALRAEQKRRERAARATGSRATSRDVARHVATSPDVVRQDATAPSPASPLPSSPTPPTTNPPSPPPPASPSAQPAPPVGAAKRGRSAKATDPDAAAPWMGDVQRLVVQRFGTAARPPKGTATALRPVVDAFGEDGMLARLELFLAQAHARFVDFHRFARTPDAWGTPGGPPTVAPTAPGAPARRPAPTADPLEPAALRARFAQHDLDRSADRDTYLDRVDAARPDDHDPDAWRALVMRHLKPWDLGAITFAPEAEKKLAQRLAAAQQGAARDGSHPVAA